METNPLTFLTEVSLPSNKINDCLEQNLPSQATDKPVKLINKKIICILTRTYNPYWFNFLKNNFIKNDFFGTKSEDTYEIYMVIDKNPGEESLANKHKEINDFVNFYTLSSQDTEKPFILPSQDNIFGGGIAEAKNEFFETKCRKSRKITEKPLKINIVQVSDELCIQSKYYKSSSCTNLKDIVAWDKALYFFTRYETDYDSIWFLEDDVLFYDLNTIQKIDEKYPSSDLLSSFHEINESGNIYNGWNHWCNVVNRIATPWAHSLISASRLSRRLMERVDEYVKNNNSLMFIEALFSTLALHNNYLVDNPEELASSITYNKEWSIEEMTDKNKIYHPLKKTEEHEMYRKRMGET